MFWKSKIIYIASSVAIGIIALLVAFLALMSTGSFGFENKPKLTFASESFEKIYDGTPLEGSGWTLLSGSLAEGHTETITALSSQTDVGVSLNNFSVTIADATGADVTSLYEIEVLPGTLVINPAYLKLTSESVTKPYDGKPLSYERYRVTAGKLVEGHYIETQFDSLVDSGSIANAFTAQVFDQNGNDVSLNYNIVCDPGILTVTQRKLNIRSESSSKNYDGKPFSNEHFTATADGGKFEHTVNLRFVGTITEVGEADNEFEVDSIIDANGNDVTHNYDITKQTGKLTVEKRELKISTKDDIKEYDGQPLSNSEYSIVGGSLAPGQKADVILPNSITDVGEKPNSVTDIIITDENGDNVTSNYALTYFEGSLTVTPRHISVLSLGDKKPYDGKPLTKPEWEYNSSAREVNGHKITVSVTGSRTEVGQSENTISNIIVRTQDGKVVTSNYTFTRQLGLLTVLPLEGGEGGEIGGNPPNDTNLSGPDSLDMNPAFKIWSDISGGVYLRDTSFGGYKGNGWKSAKEYDGNLLDAKYGMQYLNGIALEKAGYSSHRLSIDILPDAGVGYILPYYLDRKVADYTIQKSDARFAGNTEKIYSSYYYNYDNKLTSFDLGGYSAAEKEYRKFVYDNYRDVPATTLEFLKGIIDKEGFKRDDPNIVSKVATYIQNSAVYNLEYDRGLDKETDIVIAFLSKYKEGICQHYASAGTLMFRALGIPARYTTGFVGKTIAGTWNVIPKMNAHAWVEIYTDNMGWVQVEVTGSGFPGNPEIAASTIVVKPVDQFMKYSASTNELSANGKLQGLASLEKEGYTYEATVAGKQSGLGISYSVIENFKLLDPEGKDVTSGTKLTLEFLPGILQIYQYELDLYTDSANFDYDGTEKLSEPDGCRFEGNLGPGHKVKSIKATGLQREAGQSANTCEIVIVDSSGSDVTSWYKLNKRYGMLSVAPRSITIEAGSASRDYDPTAENGLTCDTYELTSAYPDPLGKGDTIKVSLFGYQTNVGSSPNVVSSVEILDAYGNDVTSSYSIKTINGTLTVIPPKRS